METNKNNNNTLGNEILDKIKEGKIKMKSRSYFVMRAILFALGVCVLFLFVIYLISFIVFSLRVSGLVFLPGFGFFGLRILLGSLPWLLIILAGVLVIVLEVFAKHVSFVYKRPVVYSLLGIIGIVLITGFIIGFSPFHTSLFHNAREGRLPLIGQLYRGYGAPRFHNFHNGSIIEITSDGFTMETPNGETLSVVTSDVMKKDLSEDDKVLVIGERKGDTIQANVLRKIDEDSNFFSSRKGMMRRPMPR